MIDLKNYGFYLILWCHGKSLTLMSWQTAMVHTDAGFMDEFVSKRWMMMWGPTSRRDWWWLAYKVLFEDFWFGVFFVPQADAFCFQLPWCAKATCLLLMEGFVLCLLILICQWRHKACNCLIQLLWGWCLKANSFWLRGATIKSDDGQVLVKCRGLVAHQVWVSGVGLGGSEWFEATRAT